MPFFCNRCQDVVELRIKKLNWRLLLIVGSIVGIVFAGVGAMIPFIGGATSAIIGFLVGFLIGAAIIYKIYSNQQPFCMNCKGYDYYEIAPHEAAALTHAKKMREEQRQFEEQMLQRQR